MEAETNRDKIVNTWLSLERPGAKGVVDFLHQSDFFVAPCSTEHHLSRPGGLAEHTLNVLLLLREKAKRYELKTPTDSITICGLGHDLCKANFYVKGKKNVKEGGMWREKDIYLVKDQFPMGHGEKSVSILQDYLSLTEEEKLAIRWHMAAFDASIHFNYPNGFPYREACKKYPLVTLLFTADYEASQVIEK
jgi:hypothetical protein